MFDPETSMGGDAQSFPTTSWSVVLGARAEPGASSREALARLFATYWKPVYVHIRRRWRKSNEDAKDLTQEFFATLLERGAISQCRADGARFRSFVRRALENFLVDRHRRALCLRRGGQAKETALDAAAELAADPEDQEFPREWAIALMRASLTALEEMYTASGRSAYFEVLRRTRLGEGDRPTYADTAATLGISVDDVQNYLRHAQHSLRDLLVRNVRETLAEGEDVETELATLFGRGLGR